jgi:hypothetical protein
MFRKESMLKIFSKKIFSKIKTVVKNPGIVIWSIQEWVDRNTDLQLKAKEFLEKQGVLSLLKKGDKEEIGVSYLKLANLYNLIQTRKPKVILEFGVGFSTIVMAAALKDNHDRYNQRGHLYTIDAIQQWLNNTENKLSPELKQYVTFHYSPLKIYNLNNQLCSHYESLPNICPNFVFLDAPSPLDVIGNVNGLNFNEWRPIVAADILLYESSAPLDFFIFVDGRWRNCNFLRNNFKGKFKHIKKIEQKYQTFEFIR